MTENIEMAELNKKPPTLMMSRAFLEPVGGQIYGIHTATHGFFDAYNLRYKNRKKYAHYSDDINEDINKMFDKKKLHYFRIKNSDFVENCAFYYELPRPDQFWKRSYGNSNRYSICGINHTLSGGLAYNHIRDIFISPYQEWDAIICTSLASRKVISNIFEMWRLYFCERGYYSKKNPKINLPVIPLGIDTEKFLLNDSAKNGGTELRRKLNIEKEDIVILFLGRLNYSSKAHPFPMFHALETAHKATGRNIHLLNAGWYPSDAQKLASEELSNFLCPSVKVHNIGMVSNENKSHVFSAADIFISLADNIQETFGITIIEAMASGLPVIASNWDGYRDTVVHGSTGFLIETIMPASGTGFDIGMMHSLGRNYNRYLLDVAQATAIDINAVSQALITLIQDTNMRLSMGMSGQKRAREKYDWSLVLQEYEMLWSELYKIRNTSIAKKLDINPNVADPFYVFGDFPSYTLKERDLISLERNWQMILQIASKSPIVSSPGDILIPIKDIPKFLQNLSSKQVRVCDILDASGFERNITIRTIVWLKKLGVVNISRS